jgi:acetolactate synthase-1/2/3 large subunit
MKVHTAVARALRDNGVETLFGLIGDANMFHVLDFVESEQGRFIGSVVESGAVSMADGYARVSGRVGVISVTHGPAAANAVNATVEAVRANSPLVLITGDTPAKRGYPQQIDLNALFAATGAEYYRVLTADNAVDDIAIVLARAAAQRRPVVLDIPIDLQLQDIDYQASKFRPYVPQAARPDEEALDAALGILASANRPLIVAGRGAVNSGAGPALVELADFLDAPLATTASAKDMFRGHPYNLGLMGSYGLPWAIDVMVKADCIAVFGAGLNHQTTVDGDLTDGRALIQCDVDAENIGRYTPVNAAITADAKATALAMVERLKAADFRPGSFRTAQLGAGVLDRSPRDDYRDRSSGATLDMRTAMIVLNEILPEERVIAVDGGRFMAVPWRYLHVSEPRDFIQTVAFGSIGLGTGAAIGAAVAAPDKLTVGVAGDGGAMMGLIEFSTAVRHGIPFVMIILNDGSYGSEYGKLEQHGYDPKKSYVEWPEFADVATALGGTGITVRTVDELRAAASRFTNLTEPLLIDIKSDPTIDHRFS